MADEGVCGGVPYGLIDCIQNASQLVTPGAQQAVQAAALLRGLDFTGVGRADCAQVVGVVQARFHERYLAVEFKAVDRKGGGRQAEFAKHRGIENTLVGQVVNGVQAGHGGRCRAWPKLEASGRQSRMPIVAVHQLRGPVAIEPVGQVGRRPAECGKAAVVVGIWAASGVFVRVTGPIKKGWRVQHVGTQRPGASRYASELAQTHGNHFAPGHLKFAHHARGLERLSDGRKTRQQGAHVATQSGQGLRQGAGDVCQTAGLEERKNFGTDLQNTHSRKLRFRPLRRPAG